MKLGIGIVACLAGALGTMFCSQVSEMIDPSNMALTGQMGFGSVFLFIVGLVLIIVHAIDKGKKPA
jgi:hypothetical protein